MINLRKINPNLIINTKIKCKHLISFFIVLGYKRQKEKRIWCFFTLPLSSRDWKKRTKIKFFFKFSFWQNFASKRRLLRILLLFPQFSAGSVSSEHPSRRDLAINYDMLLKSVMKKSFYNLATYNNQEYQN